MNESKMQQYQLAQLQSLPLNLKMQRSLRKARDFWGACNGDVYVAFSGGRDSTVLLHLIRNNSDLMRDIPAVFADTGLEFPEIRDFVKTIPNVTWVKPKMTFRDVITTYGYPIISKRAALAIQRLRSDKVVNVRYRNDLMGVPRENGRVSKFALAAKWQFLLKAPFKISSYCCDIMKKQPMKRYEKLTGKHAFVGTMACDSLNRQVNYLKQGCNIITDKRKTSAPLSFWTDADIREYIATYNVPICSLYEMGYETTGCAFCAFGAHMKSPNQFELMAKTHPALHKYCMEKLGMQEVLDFAGIKSK